MTRLIILLGFAFCSGCQTVKLAIPHKPRPIVIAHRGASGYLPEHTLEAYKLAIEMGADFIEPDVVVTKDGVLICRHENEIGGTTDVSEKFPRRRKTKTIDGEKITGWFTEDFTLAEIKRLRAKQRLPYRDQKYNGLYEIPTLKEVLEMLAAENKARTKKVGVYPETKHPTYFTELNLAMEEKLVETLREHGFDDPKLAYIQSFEVENLKKLNTLTQVPLIQLIDDPNKRPYDNVVNSVPTTYRDMLEDSGLKEIKTYADGIGPWKGMIIGEGNAEYNLGLIERAHRHALKVHPYTFRSDAQHLPKSYGGNYSQEYEAFFQLKADGVFSDFPDHALSAREKFFRAE